MNIKPLSPNFIIPQKSSEKAGAFDLFMPESGQISGNPTIIPLGFATAIPENHIGLMFPRSGCGTKFGVELTNTCGIIDSDYRGEWKASLKTKDSKIFTWSRGDRVLQFLIVPVADIILNVTDTLDDTRRGAGGFGSTGK